MKVMSRHFENVTLSHFPAFCQICPRHCALFQLFNNRIHADVPTRGGGSINGLGSSDLEDDDYMEEDSDEIRSRKETGNRLGGPLIIDRQLSTFMKTRIKLASEILEYNYFLSLNT